MSRHPADEEPLRGWRRAFRLPASRGRARREVDDEIAFHLAMRESALRDGGLTDTGAHRRARERFGDVERIREATVREDLPQVARARAGAGLRDLAFDLRVALRQLRRAPGFAAAAVLTLALGIGATTAIFSVAYGVLLRPLPFAAPDRLVQLTFAEPASVATGLYLSAPEYLDIPAAVPSLAGLGAFHESEPTLEAEEGRPERLRAAAASSSLFQTLGVRALAGRLYGPDDERPGVERVLVLDHRFWQRRFAGDPGVVGRSVRVSGRPATVVGVLPPNVHVGDREAFFPLVLDPAQLGPRGSHYLEVIARLAPGTTLERAHAELASLARRWVADHPDAYPDPAMTMSAVPLRDVWVGASRPTLLVLLGAVALLLLLACVNVANLLLVRAEARGREIGVCVALGAGRGRLVRQLLTETALLALLGAAVGLPLAVLGVRGLLVLNPEVVPPSLTVGVDGAVLAVAAFIVVAAALLAGLVPAMQASRTDVRAAISAGAVGGGRRGGRLRAALVALEFAVATLVLVGAALVGRSFWRLQQVDPGFRSASVLTFDVQMRQARAPADSLVPEAYADLLARLAALPGVRAAASVSHLPMNGTVGSWVVEAEDRPARSGEALLSPNFIVATADYLPTLGIPILAGRGPSAADRATDPPIVVVSASLARALWPGRDPVGRRMRLGGPSDNSLPWMTVVGVAGDVRSEALGAEPRPAYYMLDAQFPRMAGGATRSMTIVLRAEGGEAATVALAPGVRQVVREFDSGLAIANLRSLTDVVSSTVARPRFAAVVLVAFGAAALLLAVVGAYGVLAYTVERRRREMGIRIALGARTSQVRGLVVRSGLALAAVGLAAGLAGAFAGARLLDAVLYDVRATDPASFAAATLLLAAAALAASWIPARRAVRVDPAVALRPE